MEERPVPIKGLLLKRGWSLYRACNCIEAQYRTYFGREAGPYKGLVTDEWVVPTQGLLLHRGPIQDLLLKSGPIEGLLRKRGWSLHRA